MIIRKNTPIGVRVVPSPARKHANVFRSILGGVTVLFTVRKHACAPKEGAPGYSSWGIFADNQYIVYVIPITASKF